jgi:sugar phosphate isomerase/epimerase
LGAAGVEIDARRELQPPVSRTAIRQLLKWLDDYRLRLACLTFQIRHGLGDSPNLERRIEALKDTLRLAYQLRCQSVVCDIGQVPAVEQVTLRDQWRDVANDLGRTSHKEGAFLAARTGSMSPRELGQFFAELDPGSLMVSLDPGNVLLHGHALEGAIEALGGHIVHLHARDAVRDFAARKAVEVEVGRGSVDWSKTLAELEQNGFQGYITVGREESPHPQLECQHAFQYLQNLF